MEGLAPKHFDSALITLINNAMTTKKNPPSLSPALKDELLRFIEYHPAKRFDRNLRKLLLEFLQYKGAIEAEYLNDLLYDLEGLFDLLDAIQEHDDLRLKM